MKTLACKDAGVDCDFVAKADSEEEVLKIAMEHAQKVHPDKVAQMAEEMSNEEMTKELRSKIKEA